LTKEVERLQSCTSIKASQPAPAVVGKVIVEATDCNDNGATDGSISKPETWGDLPSPLGKQVAKDSAIVKSEGELRILELEAQNLDLTRQLNSRPIVYQFAPLPADEVDVDGPLDEDVEVGGAEDTGGPSVRVYIYVAAVWCRRRSVRGLSQCRKLRFAQSLERSLRAFTRSLLQRPLLLWLFYVHVFALWVIEFWRQAVSQPLATDPSTRINHYMETATKLNNGR